MNPIEQQFFNDLEKKLWTRHLDCSYLDLARA